MKIEKSFSFRANCFQHESLFKRILTVFSIKIERENIEKKESSLVKAEMENEKNFLLSIFYGFFCFFFLRRQV